MSEEQKQQVQLSMLPPTAPQEEELSIDIMEILFRLLAKWKLILCVSLICMFAFGAYTDYRTTPMYKATSTIYILSRDSVINMSDLQLGSALTNDYIKLFKTWEVQEAVISSLNLPYSYNYMLSHLSVVNASGTRMLDISFTSSNPEEAALVANEYAKIGSQYIADTMLSDKPTIMSVALVPTNPYNINHTGDLMKGFLIGFVLTAGIIALLAILDDKYKTADDIRKYTGLATLAVIPVEGNEKAKKSSKGKKKE